MTAQELINSALRLINVIGSGGTPSSAESADALLTLNAMIDQWNAEPAAIYKHTRQQFTLSGASTYSIGTGQTWNTVRPVRILSAVAMNAGGIMQPVRVVDGVEFGHVLERTVTANWPKVLHCDYEYPNASVAVAPLSSGTIELYMLQPVFTELASLATALPAMPPAYKKALRYNLAIDLASEYGRPVDATLAATAAETKARLGALNGLNHQSGAAAPAAPAA